MLYNFNFSDFGVYWRACSYPQIMLQLLHTRVVCFTTYWSTDVHNSTSTQSASRHLQPHQTSCGKKLILWRACRDFEDAQTARRLQPCVTTWGTIITAQQELSSGRTELFWNTCVFCILTLGLNFDWWCLLADLARKIFNKKKVLKTSPKIA